MPKYRIEVLCRVAFGHDEEWRPVRPSNGAPYEWHTKEEADRTMQSLYPASNRTHGKVRVVEYRQ